MAVDVGGAQDHLSHGSHSLDLLFLNEDIEVWRCDTCFHLEAYCMHVKNSWNEDGTELTCDFCGVDGT